MNTNLNSTLPQPLQKELYVYKQIMHAPRLSFVSDSVISLNKNKEKEDLQTEPSHREV